MSLQKEGEIDKKEFISIAYCINVTVNGIYYYQKCVVLISIYNYSGERHYNTVGDTYS